MNAGDNGHAGGLEPVWMSENGGKEIREVEDAGDQKNDFNLPIGTFQNQNPNEESSQGNRDILGDAEKFHGDGNAGKFSNDVGEIDEKTCGHDKERGAESEFLANEIGETFAGNDAHASAHFHGDVQGDGHGDKRPEQRIAVSAAGLGVGGDAAGIVIDIGSDDAGTDDGEKKEHATAPGITAGEEVESAGAEAVDEDVDGGEVHGK